MAKLGGFYRQKGDKGAIDKRTERIIWGKRRERVLSCRCLFRVLSQKVPDWLRLFPGQVETAVGPGMRSRFGATGLQHE